MSSSTKLVYISRKCVLKGASVFLCLEEHSVYYSFANKLLRAWFRLTTSLYKLYPASAQMGIKYMYKTFLGRNVITILQNPHRTQVLRYMYV